MRSFQHLSLLTETKWYETCLDPSDGRRNREQKFIALGYFYVYEIKGTFLMDKLKGLS